MPGKKKTLTPARRPGAQPRNHNALKGGFYSPRFTNPELSELKYALGDGLDDEIALLRVVIRRVFNFANDHDKQDYFFWSHCSNTLGTAGVRLTSMVRVNALLNGNPGILEDAILDRIDSIRQKLGYPDPRKPANAPT